MNLWTILWRINSFLPSTSVSRFSRISINDLFEIGDSYPDNHPFPRVSLYRRKPFYRAFRFRIWNQPCRNTWPRSRWSHPIICPRPEVWWKPSFLDLGRSSSNDSWNVDKRRPTGWVNSPFSFFSIEFLQSILLLKFDL